VNLQVAGSRVVRWAQAAVALLQLRTAESIHVPFNSKLFNFISGQNAVITGIIITRKHVIWVKLWRTLEQNRTRTLLVDMDFEYLPDASISSMHSRQGGKGQQETEGSLAGKLCPNPLDAISRQLLIAITWSTGRGHRI
jgi:hypothetical protein